MLRLDSFLPYRLSVASNAVSRVIARTYESLFGLKIPEWRVVAVLGEAGDLTQAEIVARTEMDKMSISRACATLAQRRLIARAADDADARAKRVRLTRQGRDLYARVAPEALRLEADLIDGFTADERAQLAALLDRLQKRAAEMAACGNQ